LDRPGDPITSGGVNGYQGRLRKVGDTSYAIEGEVVSVKSVKIGNQFVAEIDLAVSFSPGDNFRVVASLDKAEVQALKMEDAFIEKWSVPYAGAPQVIDEDGNAREFKGLATSPLTVWRRLHIEQDRMSAAGNSPVPFDMLDNRKITADPKKVDYTLSDGSVVKAWQVPTDATIAKNEFEGGILRDSNNRNFSIVGNDANGTVFVVPRAQARDAGPTKGLASMYQDDYIAKKDEVPELRIDPTKDKGVYDLLQSSRDPLKNPFAEAFVQPFLHTLDEFDSFIPTLSHVEDGKILESVGNQRGIAGKTTDLFWGVYVATAYEPGVSKDLDPDEEKSQFGVTSSGNEVSLVYLEPIRDYAELPGSRSENEIRARTAVHEIGHQFDIATEKGQAQPASNDPQMAHEHRTFDSLGNDNPNIMYLGTENISVAAFLFDPYDLDAIRDRVHSPGPRTPDPAP